MPRSHLPQPLIFFERRRMTPIAINMSGDWCGTYWQAGHPTPFAATLVQGGNILDGRILDANYLGEAWITGELLGSRIFFVKRYVMSSPSPIRYSGTLAADGSYMYGHWRIGCFDSGTWEAYRAEDALTAELAIVLATKSVLTSSRLENKHLPPPTDS